MVWVLICQSLFSTYPTFAQWGWNGINGKGAVISKQLSLPTIEGLALAINATVHLKQGNKQTIEIKAQQNIIDNIKKEVKDDIWNISYKENVRDHEPIHIYITLTNLTKATISGSGDIIGETKFTNLDNLKLATSGSGDIKLEVYSKSTAAAITGSGNILVKGSADNNTVSITGSGDFKGYDFLVNTSKVQITGSGNSQVTAKENLDISITGSGDVYYRGTPSLKSRIVGSGDVYSKN